MTSSTLSSDPAEPRWAYVWALTALLVLVVAGAWELLVRQADLGPDYVDSEVLWADTRHRLNSGPTNSIVLLGASRAQRAIDVDTMSEHFIRPVYQLSIEGSSYLPVLENLAVDPRVRGTIVVSIAPVFTFNRLISQVDKGLQAKYLEYYNNQSYARRLEQKLTLALQGRLAFRSPGAKLSEAIPALIETGEMPARDYKTIFRNRVVHIDPELMEVPPTDEGIVALYLQNVEPYPRDEFAPVVNYIATVTSMLRQKGVQVIFVRLPSAGAVRALEADLFPRDRFWGVPEQNVDASFVHFEDYPELAGFVSRDGSHIDSTRIVEFTRRLNAVLGQNGLASRFD